MAKARFCISNKLAVQEVGLRVIAVSTMMEMQFRRGTARNMEDGSVEVLVEGDEEKIRKLRDRILERLKMQLKELGYEKQMQETKNPACSDLDFNVGEDIPELMESSQQLMLEQVGKGVVYLKKLEKLDTLSEKMDVLPKKLDTVSEKLDTLSEKMDVLPKNIAEEMAKIIKK